jgi:hypothetical protein
MTRDGLRAPGCRGVDGDLPVPGEVLLGAAGVATPTVLSWEADSGRPS